jgi:hypothetical protein
MTNDAKRGFGACRFQSGFCLPFGLSLSKAWSRLAYIGVEQPTQRPAQRERQKLVGWVDKPSPHARTERWVSFLNPAYSV